MLRVDSRLDLGVALLGAFVFIGVGRAQDASRLASLHGTIYSKDGKPVAEADVRLKKKASPDQFETHSDARGAYSFTQLQEGPYGLEAFKDGYSGWGDIYLKAGEPMTVNLPLSYGPKSAEEAKGTTLEYYDRAEFSVAGVTDTTSLGGHGSDTVVRTRDSIAKDTASLGKPASGTPANALHEKSLRAEVESHPDSFDANRNLGRFLLDVGQPRDAIAYLEHASTANPSEYQNSYDLASAYAQSGDYARAREQAQILLARNDRAELHHLLGDANEKLGDSLEAVRRYQRAAELDPRESYLFDWGSELLLHHAPEPAIEVFTRGNHLFPRSTRMLLGLGAASYAHGSYDDAVRHICEASDLDPNDPKPYLFLGKLQSAEKTASPALVEELHRFVMLQPQNAEANYYYAVSLWKQNRGAHDKAVQVQIESLLNNAIRLDPEFAPARLQLGIFHAEAGDDSAAISNYQRAAQLDPEMEEAHYRLAQAYRQQGQQDKAKEELHLYEQIVKESAQKLDRERHEVPQFVYTLRDKPTQQ